MWAEKERIKRKKNIAVTQAWTSKDSQRSLTKYRSFNIILEYLKLYCQYSSLSSLKYLADSQKTWFERILWVIIHCTIISGLIFMVYISYKEFVTSPILTSMDSDSYSTIELNFPAIAICPVNRISRRSAMELATDIFNANVTDLSMDEIMELLKQLGNNYPSNFIMERNRDIEIDQLLTKYYKGFYDITKIMKNLSPLCMAMLLKCKLHGTYRPCTTLFEFRKTQDGFCCTFNYIHIYRVLQIIVFHPADYPDVSSGGVTEVLAMPRTETYIDVSATSFFSTEIIENYPVNQRNCIFSEEIRTTHSDTIYTYSDCIVDCKIYDVIKCCNCRPFFYPRRGEKEFNKVSFNFLLSPLHSYKFQFLLLFVIKVRRKQECINIVKLIKHE
ncbi:hypothetical protein ACFW04_000050 [Cataglyphis niger]